MRNTLIPARYFLVLSVALAGLQTAAQAELNLTIPKASPTTSGAPDTPAKRLDLGQTPRPPEGYQASDQCPAGSHVSNMQRFEGTVFYQCARSGSSLPPAVRDSDRYPRGTVNCEVGSMGPQCRQLPSRPY